MVSLCIAQDKSAQNKLQPPPPNITIDGDAKEWGDSLRYYNAEKRLNYSLANTKDTLYMAVRINDRSEHIRVLRAGITLSVNTKGKKKESFSITFPPASNAVMLKHNYESILNVARCSRIPLRKTDLAGDQ